ncbi:acyl-CoA carboxylase epsilon subunit [Streptomyces violens]|uniref:acyl-CoA carboxylase epsilon subunit n=1 Tax=Streptomyces violens TaxID=66377 RepID=UPI001FDFAB67|nr:acyl-CoA carboxylase epsilon subunit [Streptomyces violens]
METTKVNPADTSDRSLVRVEKGEASEEELAALTAVLLARAAHRPAALPAQPHATAARWRRLERQRGFRGARSWQG